MIPESIRLQATFQRGGMEQGDDSHTHVWGTPPLPSQVAGPRGGTLALLKLTAAGVVFCINASQHCLSKQSLKETGGLLIKQPKQHEEQQSLAGGHNQHHKAVITSTNLTISMVTKRESGTR